MVNLNRKRLAIYVYFLSVIALIFSLSFSVQGSKITGNAILQFGGKLITNISSFRFIMIVFEFLISLAFAIFIIRHAQEIKKNVHSKNSKLIASIIIFLLIISFFCFNIYFSIT